MSNLKSPEIHYLEASEARKKLTPIIRFRWTKASVDFKESYTSGRSMRAKKTSPRLPRLDRLTR